jgi:hypothetical protein
MPRRWIASAGAVALLVVTMVAANQWYPELRGRRSGGPLACSDCGRTATGAPARVGQAFSMGPLTLRNTSRKTVTLERVQLVDVDPGLELVGVLVVEPDGRHPLVGGGRGYPPREPGGTTHPVPDYVLVPTTANGRFVQILVGIRLGSPGRAGSRGIAVDYRADGVPYRATFDDSLWLCTDPDERDGCIDPDR